MVRETPMTIAPNTHLGSALLIAEFEGGYEAVALASTLSEARDLAAEDSQRRAALLDRGQDCACPTGYKLWNRSFDGSFVVVEIHASTCDSPPLLLAADLVRSRGGQHASSIPQPPVLESRYVRSISEASFDRQSH